MSRFRRGVALFKMLSPNQCPRWKTYRRAETGNLAIIFYDWARDEECGGISHGAVAVGDEIYMFNIEPGDDACLADIVQLPGNGSYPDEEIERSLEPNMRHFNPESFAFARYLHEVRQRLK